MKIAVCVKLVPSIEGQITIKDPSVGIADEDAKIGINTYDEVALEQAVQLREKGVATEVITYTISHAPKMESTVRNALARGADRAVLIADDSLKNADAITIAKVLAKAMQNDGIEMVFCGMVATDMDGGQLPPMLAEYLGWAHVSGISKLEVEGTSFKAWKKISSGSEAVIAGSGAVVFSCDKNLQKPRFIKLKDRRNAKKKPFGKLSVSEVDVEIGEATVKYTNWALPPKKGECKFIEGDSQTAVNELIRLLREESKVL